MNYFDKMKQELGTTNEFKPIDENTKRNQLNLKGIENTEDSLALTLGRVKLPSEGEKIINEFLNKELP